NTYEAKRVSRSKMKEPHVSGRKSFARLAHEMAALKDIPNVSTITSDDQIDITNDAYSKFKAWRKEDTFD
ncbi:hypothetical protein R6Q59_023553, partial [Mikania micrantha]